MLWQTRVCGVKSAMRCCALGSALAATGACPAQGAISVPTAPPAKAEARSYRDAKYGVRFRVPAGWSLSRKDREVSTFRLDARSATRRSQMRAVAALNFNPFPESTFSGALFYYSVERHTTDDACALQASASGAAKTLQTHGLTGPDSRKAIDLQSIGGMEFAHGHDEHGGICVEARDEVYTAYRKGSCYRFDLAMNTFCSISSGAQELTHAQLQDIAERMTTILSSVVLDWEKSGARPVQAPHVPVEQRSPQGIPANAVGQM